MENKSVWGWLTLLVFFFFSPYAIGGGESSTFFIVQSASLGPYNKATTSFKVSCGGEHPVLNLEGKREREGEALDQIKKYKPAVVVTVGKLATFLITQKLRDIPIVFGVVLNPPEKLTKLPNVAGISLTIPVKTQIETLTALIPHVKAIGTLYNPKKMQNEIRELFKLASERGIKLVASKIDEPKDAPRAIRALVGDMDAFLLLPDPTVANREVFFQILNFTVKKRIPLWTPSPAFVEAGALVSLAPNYEGIGEQMCSIAKKIAGGISPAQIGVIPPERFDLTFNLKTAEQLNLNMLPIKAAQYCVKAKCKINVY